MKEGAQLAEKGSFLQITSPNHADIDETTIYFVKSEAAVSGVLFWRHFFTYFRPFRRLKNWLPFHLSSADGAHFTHWCLIDPFFIASSLYNFYSLLSW